MFTILYKFVQSKSYDVFCKGWKLYLLLVVCLVARRVRIIIRIKVCILQPHKIWTRQGILWRNQQGKILIIGYVWISFRVSIKNVLYVGGLKYNLLGISQLCDNRYMVSSNKDKCIISLCYDKTILSASDKKTLRLFWWMSISRSHSGVYWKR